MPVRKLPLLDPAEAKQAGLDIAAVDGHLHARSSSSGVSQGSPDAPGRTTSAGAGAIAVAGAAVAASGASKSGAKNIATVRLGADGADGGRTRAATDLVANHGEARPLVTAGAPVTGSQVHGGGGASGMVERKRSSLCSSLCRGRCTPCAGVCRRGSLFARSSSDALDYQHILLLLWPKQTRALDGYSKVTGLQ